MGNRHISTKGLPRGTKLPAIDRFWNKVDKESSLIGCWLWVGAKHGHGYGIFCPVGSKTVRAHRWLWEQLYGPIPPSPVYPGTCLLHSCDVRNCVNPAHLRLGTQADNSADKFTRGRAVVGERHWKTTATPELVAYIRENVKKKGDATRGAKEIGLSQKQVDQIAKHMTWRHLP